MCVALGRPTYLPPKAKERPELINLLGMAVSFPDVSLSKLVGDRTNSVGGVHPLLAPPPPKKVFFFPILSVCV